MVRKLFVMIALGGALTGCGGGGGGSASIPQTGGTITVPTAAPTTVATATPTATSTATVAPTAAPTATGLPVPTAPPTYAALYSLVNNNVTNFTNQVNASCPAPSTPTRVVAELLPANGNYVINTLPGQSPAYITQAASNAVQYAVTLRQMLGVNAVELSIVYPLLIQNPANFPNGSWNTANGALFLSYYQQVIAGLRAQNIGVIVETNVVFPGFSNSTFNYNGLTVQSLIAGKTEQAQRVLDSLKPDYMLLESEPLSLATNTGIASLNSPSVFASEVAGIRAGLNSSSSPQTKIGAGSADWSDPSFITALGAIPNLDFLDLHMYPPANLQSGISQLALIKSMGKQVTITENWLDKTDPTVDVGSNGPNNAMTVLSRNSFSFWAPLDITYLQSMNRLAQCNGVAFTTFWDINDWMGYIDFNQTTAAYTYDQMVQAQGAAFANAVSTDTVSPLGLALRKMLTGS